MPRIGYLALFAGLIGFVGGCSGSRWDQYLQAGRHLDLVRSYEADSAAQGQELALYVTGLSYASPASPAHDPAQARRLFERLVQFYPESKHRVVVDPMLALYSELEAKSDEVTAARTERDSARVEVARLQAEVSRVRVQSELYSDLSRHFRQALNLRDARARSLERQLEELKQIDLGQ